MKEVILCGDFVWYVVILCQFWEVKKQLVVSVSNFQFDVIYDDVIDVGVLVGKILGVGGGGFFMFFVLLVCWMVVLC